MKIDWPTYEKGLAEGVFKSPVLSMGQKPESQKPQKTFTEAEKEEFMKNARKAGEEIKSMHISDELHHILDNQGDVGQNE